MKKLKRQVTLNNSMSVEGNTKKFNIADESESTHSNEKNEELHANSGGKPAKIPMFLRVLLLSQKNIAVFFAI